jgi:hypothetical protein
MKMPGLSVRRAMEITGQLQKTIQEADRIYNDRRLEAAHCHQIDQKLVGSFLYSKKHIVLCTIVAKKLSLYSKKHIVLCTIVAKKLSIMLAVCTLAAYSVSLIKLGSLFLLCILGETGLTKD